MMPNLGLSTRGQRSATRQVGAVAAGQVAGHGLRAGETAEARAVGRRRRCPRAAHTDDEDADTMAPPPLTILPGTVEFLALGALAHGGEMHGFEVLRWIGEATAGQLLPEEGALYPALHRMEKRRWLRSTWGVSEKGRRAKYYEITASGRRALEKSTGEWERYVAAVHRVVIADGGR
jgi:PadR family transcriptional regulator, regulatory protein PadR